MCSNIQCRQTKRKELNKTIKSFNLKRSLLDIYIIQIYPSPVFTGVRETAVAV